MTKEEVLNGQRWAEPFDPNRVPGHHIDGWMLPVELYWLNEMAKSMHQIMEIGCYKGRSSYALAEGCPGRVFCVDHFTGEKCSHQSVDATLEDKEIFLENMKEFIESGKAVLLEMTSKQAAEECDGLFDMVFIDGAHDYESVQANIREWAPFTKLVMCGHDFDMPEVRKAVLDIFGKTVRNGFGNIWWVGFAENIGKVD